MLTMMLVMPTAQSAVKFVLLVLILTSLIWARLQQVNHFHLHVQVAKLGALYALLGSGFMLLGASHGGSGALAVSTTYVLWPLVFTLLTSTLHEERQLDSVTRVFWISSVLIAAYIALFTLSMAGFIPSSWAPPIYTEAQSGLAANEGYIEISVRQLASLLFLGPYFLAFYIVWPQDHRPPVGRNAVLIILSICVMISAFGGRRALLVALGAAFFIALALSTQLPRSQRQVARHKAGSLSLYVTALLLALAAGFAHYFQFDSHAYINFLVTGIDFDSDQSASARRVQLIELLNAWSEHPLLGLGHGTSVHGFLRSNTHPWSYELSYIALLFHTGIIGLFFYLAGIAWIVMHGIRIIRLGGTISAHMLASLTGMLSFLLGNATNPYLEKFDFMFVIFYPLAIINFKLLNPAPQRIAHKMAKLAR
jgi:O-antigen ligase